MNFHSPPPEKKQAFCSLIIRYLFSHGPSQIMSKRPSNGERHFSVSSFQNSACPPGSDWKGHAFPRQKQLSADRGPPPMWILMGRRDQGFSKIARTIALHISILTWILFFSAPPIKLLAARSRSIRAQHVGLIHQGRHLPTQWVVSDTVKTSEIPSRHDTVSELVVDMSDCQLELIHRNIVCH